MTVISRSSRSSQGFSCIENYCWDAYSAYSKLSVCGGLSCFSIRHVHRSEQTQSPQRGSHTSHERIQLHLIHRLGVLLMFLRHVVFSFLPLWNEESSHNLYWSFYQKANATQKKTGLAAALCIWRNARLSHSRSVTQQSRAADTGYVFQPLQGNHLPQILCYLKL